MPKIEKRSDSQYYEIGKAAINQELLVFYNDRAYVKRRLRELFIKLGYTLWHFEESQHEAIRNKKKALIISLVFAIETILDTEGLPEEKGNSILSRVFGQSQEVVGEWLR